MSPIIPFDAKERLLSQARRYLADPGLILEDRERTIPILLKALRSGDHRLRREIVFLLGSFAKEDVYWTLYEIMGDKNEPEDLRDQAAIHLSVIGPFLNEPQALMRKLISDLAGSDHGNRVRAIMAMGWEGNSGAVLPLIECIYDEDQEVQEVAVNSLCNLKDSRLVGLLADRLKQCSIDQKRAILFNLWRFRDKQEEITAIYKDELEHGDPALRLDILILLGQLDHQAGHELLYRSYLSDPNPRIRALALERLGSMQCLTTEELHPFLNDSSMEVKRVALDLLHQP